MRVHSSVLAATCALVPVVALAGGETVPCPAHKAGASFRYSKTNVVYNNTTENVAKIESIEGDRVRGTNEDGLPVVTDMISNPYNIGQRKATPKFYRMPECPFVLGESRVYKDVDYDGFSPGSRERGMFTVTVDPEFESLTVPAGSFKVVKVVSELTYRSGDLDGKARTVSFYAPEIGVVVKKDFREQLIAGREIHFLYELLGYAPGQ